MKNMLGLKWCYRKQKKCIIGLDTRIGMGILFRLKSVLSIPTPDVEKVVRCKNCSIGFEVETDHPLHPVRKYIYCPDRNEEVEPDGFCKWGKRRE